MDELIKEPSVDYNSYNYKLWNTKLFSLSEIMAFSELKEDDFNKRVFTRDEFEKIAIDKYPESIPNCHICGGETVLIRGKYPSTPKRNICPTCTTERLELIAEISSKDYGVACKQT